LFSINEDNAERYNYLLNELYNSNESGMDLDESISNQLSVFVKKQIKNTIGRFGCKLSDDSLLASKHRYQEKKPN